MAAPPRRLGRPPPEHDDAAGCAFRAGSDGKPPRGRRPTWPTVTAESGPPASRSWRQPDSLGLGEEFVDLGGRLGEPLLRADLADEDLVRPVVRRLGHLAP